MNANTKAGAVLLRLLTVKRRFNGGTFKLNDMKQMTAVEWLAKEICYISIDGKYIVDNAEDVTHIVEQAKEMEKEQIIKAYETAMETDIYNTPLKVGKEYYNETFKSK